MSGRAEILALAVLVVVACNRKPKEEAAWDGKEPFSCEGDQVVTLSGKKVENAAAVPLVTARGNCKLTLVDCDLEADGVLRTDDHAQLVIERGRIEASATAPNRMVIQANGDSSVVVRGASVAGKTGIQVMGNAHLVLEGGSVSGSEHAIGAWGTSTVEVKPGTKVDGNVYYDTHVHFTGPPELRMDPTKTLVSSISPACGMVEHCYTSVGQFGRIGGRVSVQVDTKGKVASVKLDRGDVPLAVKSCLEKYQGKSLDGAGGRPGTLVCEYDGRFLEGGQGSISWWPRFTPDGAAAPDAAAPAK